MVEILAKEFNKQAKHVENLLKLHLDGNTVPFIARYRKELTGSMDENEIRDILERYEYLENLKKRKEEVIRLIDEKGKLTDELKVNILKAETLKDVEDYYAPYKSKRKTKADIAKELGLAPLSDFIKVTADESKIFEEGKKFVTEGVDSPEIAIEMAQDIIIEEIGHNIDIKNRIREIFKNEGVIASSKSKDVTGRTVYEDYYEYEEKVKNIPSHRILAIFRGERQKVLKVKINIDEEKGINSIKNILHKDIVFNVYTEAATQKALKRMLLPSIELEVRSELKEFAEEKAIKVFEENLKNILLTPPVKNKRILGIDPAFRTGCKYAAIDETGKLLNYGVIYPVEPQKDIDGSEKTLTEIIRKYNINAIAVGNGTASREVEEFIANMIEKCNLDVEYTIVSEAGASVYSASKIANEEFPELDLTIRGAISIARRVLDPLSELVKIEPKSIGVGMYQHDVNQNRLNEKLVNVIEDVVNKVGVDLNTAGYSILSYISGLNLSLAKKIVKYRDENGKFKSRKELLNVAGIGENIYRQCAGFLKIYDGEELLDKMFIHPESYDATYKLFDYLSLKPENHKMVKLALKGKNIAEIAKRIDIGLETLADIIENLEKPEIDIRSNVAPVIFKKGVVDINDLDEGMILQGKVSNVVDFGAFVDLGLKNDGLVHISEMADKFIKHPSEVVELGDIVNVKIIKIDKERGRVSLSLKL
ncbi:RNA-binding transcriptional accessory protein [Deferribacteraceae bacterium V6Fe1]|nr:RNA-binding transcriptional accessory protein [Deferribacteraceae bacterium V6Fe1]